MQHRIRLSDDDLGLLVSALAARRAMVRSVKGRAALDALLWRLDQCTPGNPHLLRGAACIHGVPLADRCDQCRERTAQYVGLASPGALPTSPRGMSLEDFEQWRVASQTPAGEQFVPPPNTDSR
jgi:hypothetical protein